MDVKEKKGRMEPGVKLYLRGGGSGAGSGGVFGDGKWRLLESIEEEGSIRKAARRLGRGYRKAWGDIKRTEEAMGRRIVTKSRGGADGGRTRLTDFGRELLEGWRRYREDVLEGVGDAFEKHLEPLLERSGDER